MRIYLIQLPNLTPEFLPELVQNFIDLQNLLDGHLQEDNIAPGSFTDASIAPGSLHRVSLSDDVPRTISGRYTGNGLANQVINLGWMPRYVTVFSITDATTFEGYGDGTTGLSAIWSSITGDVANGLAQWQGVVSNGFGLGSGAASLANKAGQLYDYVAIR